MLHCITAQRTGFASVPRACVLWWESSVQGLHCAFRQRCCQHCHYRKSCMKWCLGCVVQGAGKPSHLPSSAFGLNLSFDPITSPLSLNVLDREGKHSNWITVIYRKCTQKEGPRDPKVQGERQHVGKKTKGCDGNISLYILSSGV